MHGPHNKSTILWFSRDTSWTVWNAEPEPRDKDLKPHQVSWWGAGRSAVFDGVKQELLIDPIYYTLPEETKKAILQLEPGQCIMVVVDTVCHYESVSPYPCLEAPEEKRDV